MCFEVAFKVEVACTHIFYISFDFYGEDLWMNTNGHELGDSKGTLLAFLKPFAR